jgi:photosystem II stability/assembly factor-like uncharacterized protein
LKSFLATRKGLVILKSTPSGWVFERSHFDGVKVSYVTYDPSKKQIWVGMNHGHWGPKLHISKDKGKSFQELKVPQFPKGGETLKDFWAFARDSRGRIYIGTEPAGLFYSDDEGKSWTLNKGLQNVEGRKRWFGAGTDATALHSILIDSQDDKHLIVGISVGGVLESRDGGKSWLPINAGLRAEFMPDKNDPIVQDPHIVEMAPSDSKILWQQNHCGIFKSDNAGKKWIDVSLGRGIKSSFGWALQIDEKDPDTAYTIPALSDETRVPLQKKLIVQKTTNGGKTWKSLSKGLPQKFCYDIVYRHAFSKNQKHLIFGSTTGHVYFSKNSGDMWSQLEYQLAPIYAVKIVN